MHVCRSFTPCLPTYFTSNMFLLRAICALLTGGDSRKTVLLANVLLRLLFVFDMSLNCYTFCSCGLLDSFLFPRHVINSNNALSGRTMLNINRNDCLYFALRHFNAGAGCFVNIIARCVRYKRLTIVFAGLAEGCRCFELRESCWLVLDTFCVAKLFVLASNHV